MKKNLRFALLVVLLLSYNYSNAQLYSENFNSNFVSGWKFYNNSSSTSENSKGWIFGNPTGISVPEFSDVMDVRSPFAATNPANDKNTYLFTGFNYGSDIQGSILSKWAISPLMRLKNGDKIRFRTRQRSTSCNNANKLEVRLSTFKPRSANYSSETDSTLYLNAGANEVGNFTNLIGVINPNLLRTGVGSYPNDWTVYEFEVTGLGSNEYYMGRIALRYFVPFAGSTSCATPLNIPSIPNPPTLNPVLELVAGELCETCMALYDYTSGVAAAYNSVDQMLENYSTNSNPPVGNNGSAIGIDDFEVIPRESIFMYDATNLPSNVIHNAYDLNNLTTSTHIAFGYKGETTCQISSDIPIGRRFLIYNGTNATIKVKPHRQNNSFVLSTNDSISLAPKTYTSIYLNVNPNMSYGTYYSSFWINDKNGQMLAKAKLEIRRQTRGNPTAICKNVTLQLDANGLATLNGEMVDNGSVNGCGGTEKIRFVVSKSYDKGYLGLWDYGNNQFDCSDVGSQFVRLIVLDSVGGGRGECYATVTTINNNYTNVNTGFVQNFYVGRTYVEKNVMPVDSIVKPSVLNGCADAIPELSSLKINRPTSFSTFYPYNLNTPLEVGQYELNWRMKVGNEYVPGGGTTIVNVIDTVKPFLEPLDTTLIGFEDFVYDEITRIRYYFPKIKIEGEDLCLKSGSAHDNSYGPGYNSNLFRDRRGIVDYQISTPSYNGGDWVNEIPFNCSQAGTKFPVSVKVFDASGNFSVISKYVKIMYPSNPICKNIEVELNTWFANPTAHVTGQEVLDIGSTVVCGLIDDVTISRSEFTCADMGQTIPVTVTYITAGNAQHSCVGSVKVKPFELTQSACRDTIMNKDMSEGSYSTSIGQSLVTLPQVFQTACSYYLPIQCSATGATSFSETIYGSFQKDLPVGLTNVTRSILYVNDTIRCTQKVTIIDNIAPVLAFGANAPQNITVTVNTNGYDCPKFEHEIVNCFEQSNYKFWGFEITGDVDTTAIFRKGYVYEAHWLNKMIELGKGNYNIKVFAQDGQGNRTEYTYTVTVNQSGFVIPSVSSTLLQNSYAAQGQECSNIHNFNIDSPVNNQCNGSQEVMWYYEVLDINTNAIVSELDSIPQLSGAAIPIKVTPYSASTVDRYRVKLGYHDPQYGYGTKTFSSQEIVSFKELPNTITCPNDTSINNNNNTTFTSDFEIESPVASCAGSFWGYAVNGASTLKSTPNGASYNSNQTSMLGLANYSDAYPSLAHNQNATVSLNNGVNTITYSMIETSGNGSANACSFKVTLIDASTASMNCPADDTIHRSDLGSCVVAGRESCQQMSGFSGSYGTGRFMLKGSNPNLKLITNDMPNSITIQMDNTSTINYNDGFVQLKANCDGTISFNWEYQSNIGGFFRPFIAKGGGVNQMVGFVQSNTGVQTGSISINVTAGEYINIGVREAGYGQGYFKISNFSAPASNIVAEIEQPVYTMSNNLFFEENVKADYEIGNHQIIYSLTNTTNASQFTCVQDLVVIDDFAGSLACSDKTVYLDQYGSYILEPNEMISTCFNISNTWMTMDTLSCTDVGTHAVTINSYDNTNQLLQCNFNLTVIDNQGPRLISNIQNFELNFNGDNATLSEAQMMDMLEDPCGIQSVTASRINFGCSDANKLIPTQLTATDLNGNQSVVDVYIKVAISGFNDISTVSEDYTVCQGSNLNLLENSVGTDFKYYWKKKDKIYDSLSWNYYTLGPNIPYVNADHVYQFVNDFRRDNLPTVKKASYLTTRNPINIYELDTVKLTWEPTDIPTLNVSGAYTLLKGHNDDLYALVYNLNNGLFEMHQYNYWSTYTWTDVTPEAMVAGNFYGNDNYRFMVDGFGKVRAFSSAFVTYPYLNFYTAPFNGGWGTISVLENAKNIVGLRNGLGENRFFKINLGANDIMTLTKDSLTVDPTDNSTLFKMHSMNNEAYIAYRSMNGKICVKKFDGSSLWDAVGSLDFSNGTVTKMDISSYEDTLYVVYSEVNNQYIVKKFNGTNWVLVNSPNDNLGSLSTTNFDFVNIKNKPQILINSGQDGLISREGWSNMNSDLNPFTTNSFAPQTDVAGTETYRCEITNVNTCARIISGDKTVTVKELPIMNDHDYTTTNPNANLTTTTNAGTIKWSAARDGSDILNTGSSYQLNNITSDTAYYAFATNDICSSDTVKFTVFLNDTEIPNLNFTYQDTICYGGNDGNEIIIDTLDGTYVYSVYKKNANGDFEFFQGPNYQSIVWPGITETGTYKVLVEEPKRNSYYSEDNEYLLYDSIQMPPTEELTIEGWFNVSYSVDPSFNLALSHGNSDFSGGNAEIRNFEWYNGQFIVHNGSTSRSLAFPDLPGTYQWVHVSTVAGPSGMKIYYNGVLVASNNVASNEEINHVKSPLKLKKTLDDQQANSCLSIDEFKIWSVEKTGAEIAETMNTCLGEYQDELILFTDFDKYNLVSKEFTSVVGSSVKELGRGPYANPFPQGYRTEDVCGDTTTSKRFLPEFDVKVLPYGSEILLTQDYPYNGNEIEACGGVSAPVYAQPNGGSVYWYDAQYDGNLLGTGSYFNFYSDRDTVIYAKSVPSKFCYGTQVWIDIIENPSVTAEIHDTVCLGSKMMSNGLKWIGLGSENDSYRLYDALIGGTLYDYSSDNRELTVDDTLYIEAYNAYCTAATRTPYYIHVFKNVILDIPDTSYCGPKAIDFTFSAPDVHRFEWYDLQNNYVATVNNGETYTTTSLNDTITYKLKPYGSSEGCYTEEIILQINVVPSRVVRDSILSCTPITWRNGVTYYSSVNEVVYTKTFENECDSTYYLNLKIGNLDGKYVTASAAGACLGQTVDFTVFASQTGKSYALVDLFSGDTINRAFGNGNNLVLQTTPLTVDMNIKVVAIDSLINPNDLLICQKALDTFQIKAGAIMTPIDVITCDDYEWRGNTYTSTGVYRDTLTSVFGCDSILQLNLTINNSYNNVLNVTACNSYTYRGTTYTTSQQVVHRFGFTRFGCDSLETLNLTIGHPNSGTATISACTSYTWIDGNTYTSNNNIATYVLTNQYGCDSTVTLNLTINNTPTADAPSNVTACNSYALPALTVGNYFTGAGGTGTALFAGNLITSTQTIYVYAETGMTPNCSDENSFLITINDCSTKLATASCGISLVNMSDALYSEAVAGATDYRYEVRKQSDNSYVAVLTRGANDNLVRLSWSSAIAFNTTYSIKVSAFVGGTWIPYGTACTVTTPVRTKLATASCGVSLVNMSDALYSDAVAGATDYRYEVRKQSDNSYVAVLTRGANDNLVRLSWSSAIAFNTTYSIKVSAFVGGTWIPYGMACTVTTPVRTKLATASCGVTLATMSDALYSDAVAGATDYRYEVRKQSDNSYVTVLTRGANDNLVRLSWSSAMAFNTTYSIKVSAYVSGAWLPYGTACTVTTPISGMMTSEQVESHEEPFSLGDLSLETYPNPNDGNFTISSSHEGSFNIVNELGQLIQKVEITKENNYQTKVENLGQGVYFVTGTINNEFITKKVVVQ